MDEPYSDLDAIIRLEVARSTIKRLNKIGKSREFYGHTSYEQDELDRAVATYTLCLRYLVLTPTD